jgi:hypothetical protein
LNYTNTDASRSNVEFIASLSEFKGGGAGDAFVRSGFSNVTGVRIYFKGKRDGQSTLIISALRCFNRSTKSWLSAEIDTVEKVVKAPVLNYKKELLNTTPMIRGNALRTKTLDNDPMDLRESFIFKTGLGAGHSGSLSPYNKFMLFGREQEFSAVSNPNAIWKSSWLTAEYGFINNPISEAYYLKRYKTNRMASTHLTLPSTGKLIYWDLHPGGIVENNYDSSLIGHSYLPSLLPEFNYEFAATFSSTSINVDIIQLDYEEQPVRKIYSAPAASSSAWNTVRGRIGWYAEFSDLDAHVSSFNLESAAYASLTTKTFKSETHVDGAQLFTVDSGNKNLFTGFSPLSSFDEVLIDNQKSLSGEGSYVFHSTGSSFRPGVLSNEFFVEDWNHIFIEFDIWVPKRLKTNILRPKLWLLPKEHEVGTVGTFTGEVPEKGPVAFDFVPGAWSHVSVDFPGINSKNGPYNLIIGSDGDGNTSVSAAFKDRWWIDNVKINRQTVEWEMRALDAPNNAWVPFRRNINLQYGALHLSEDRAGKEIQLQAKALTEDAWVAEYALLPRYMTPGKINRPSEQYFAKGTTILGPNKFFKSQNKIRGSSSVEASIT